MFFFPKDCERVAIELQKALAALGIPQCQIILKRQIVLPTGSRVDADMVVVADDMSTVLYQFSIRLCRGTGGIQGAFDDAKCGLLGLWRQHRCFAVTTAGDAIEMAEIKKDGKPCWVPISDVDKISVLLGDVKSQSEFLAKRVEDHRRDNIKRNCMSLICWVAVVGGLSLIGAIVGELLGKELSWKIYYLVTLVLGMIAAAHGLVFHVKVGEGEVRIADGLKKSQCDDSGEQTATGK